MGDNSASNQPVYVQVREAIIERLADMPAGARLATEIKMAEGFKVSRSSIRLALSGLEEEGYLVRYRNKDL
jgi:DNA-binding GntR family transcriptional regulator